jgi:hypothetical protein
MTIGTDVRKIAQSQHNRMAMRGYTPKQTRTAEG